MSNRQKGILCIIGCAFCFALMNLFVNLAGDVPVIQKAFFRNAVALIFSGIVLFKNTTKEERKVTKDNFWLLFLRSLAGGIGFVCNFYAVDHMNISDASMLNKLAPFFVIIFSAIFLKEKANWFQWLSVVLAFVGSLFIVKPTFGMEVIPAVAGLIGGLGAGIAYTCVRKLGQKGTKSTFIVFFFSAFTSVILAPIVIFNYQPMEWWQWGFLILTGLAASGGQFCVTAAYTYAPAKEISVYDYSQVIFAAILGFFFLNQVPDVFSIIGYAIIIVVAIAMYLKQK
ncbi:MAG: DMT family transporter [Lachnospiraceae bacterium]|nr:DMT family transporter [Lachnospiraceae bacterium]MBQ3035669.1 DMT family transporter [Lachnospiraceae bacterium]